MVRVLISVDMEGIAGVTGHQDVQPGTAAYERFRRQMTQEANAAVAGAFEAGATAVTVNDSHDGMRNVLYEELDERASLVSGTMKPLDMVEGAQGAEAAVFIGYHAMAGSAPAVLAHTMSGIVHCWRMNGEPVGETQINAALCGHHGVPVALVSGDACLAEEVAATLPATRTVVVKWATDETTARSVPRVEAIRMIREGTRDSLRGVGGLAPWPMASPVGFEIEFSTPGAAAAASQCPGVERRSGRVVEMSGIDVVAAYRLATVALSLAMASVS